MHLHEDGKKEVFFQLPPNFSCHIQEYIIIWAYFSASLKSAANYLLPPCCIFPRKMWLYNWYNLNPNWTPLNLIQITETPALLFHHFYKQHCGVFGTLWNALIHDCLQADCLHEMAYMKWLKGFLSRLPVVNELPSALESLYLSNTQTAPLHRQPHTHMHTHAHIHTING